MDSMVPALLRIDESLPGADKLPGVSLAFSTTVLEPTRIIVKRVNPILSKQDEKVQLKPFSFALALPVTNGFPISGNAGLAGALKTILDIVGFASIVQKNSKSNLFYRSTATLAPLPV